MIPLLYGLIAMLGWGIADFLARKAIDEIGDINSLFWTQMIGAVLLGVYFLVVPSEFSFPITSFNVGLLAITSFLWAFAYLAFYKAISVGKLAVVSPIGSAWGALGAIIGFFVFGEVLSLFGYLGVSLVVLGVILASTKLSELRGRIKLDSGVVYALIAFGMWGVLFSLLKLVYAGGEVTIPFLLKAITVFLLLIIFFIRKIPIRWSRRASLYVFGVGLLDTIAFVSMTTGLQKGFVSIVGPVASTFPAVTVCLAYIFLKERLELNQWVGILSIIAGIVMLSL